MSDPSSFHLLQQLPHCIPSFEAPGAPQHLCRTWPQHGVLAKGHVAQGGATDLFCLKSSGFLVDFGLLFGCLDVWLNFCWNSPFHFQACFFDVFLQLLLRTVDVLHEVSWHPTQPASSDPGEVLKYDSGLAAKTLILRKLKSETSKVWESIFGDIFGSSESEKKMQLGTGQKNLQRGFNARSPASSKARDAAGWNSKSSSSKAISLDQLK